MNHRTASLLIVLLGIFSIISSGHCQIRGNALRESEFSLSLDSLFTHGHFEELEFRALRVLHGNKEVHEEDRLAALLYLGYVNVLGGEVEQARLDFIRALQLDPNLKLDPVFTPPRIYQTFLEVKSGLYVPLLNNNIPPEVPSYAPLLNFAVPGAGFILEENYFRGLGWFTLETIAVSSFLYSLNERKSARQKYLALSTGSDFDNHYNLYNKWHKRSVIWGLSSVVVYIGAQSDYLFNSKRFNVEPALIENNTSSDLGFRLTVRF